MNFKYKCFLQKLLSVLPKGEKLNFIFQKYITKSLPTSADNFIRVQGWAKKHFDFFNRYAQIDPKRTTYYEFGAGWDLINPIAISLLGVKTLNCIDIRQQVFPYLINDTISKFCHLKDKVSFDYSLPQNIPLIDQTNLRDVLKNYFRINYFAPMNAIATEFKDGSMDFIVSNTTLEHVPKDDIVKILKECYRISNDGAIISCLIDYQDHWSYFDKGISKYNFLRYSSSKWRRYNPSLHYQNRLRHKDYLDIISQTNFELLEVKPNPVTDKDLDLLRKLPIDSYFLNKYTLEELAVKSAWIVMRK